MSEKRNTINPGEGLPCAAWRVSDDDLHSVLGQVHHDMNNLLTVLLGNMALLEARLGTADSEPRQLVQEIASAGRQCQFLVGQLRGCRWTDEDPLCAPESVLAEIRHIGRLLLPANIDLHIDAGRASDLRVPMASGQLVQIVTNLILNAKDAMPTGGLIRIEARPSDKGELLLQVSDTGSGLTQSQQELIFRPYYTTKGTHGTGIGLCIVRAAVGAAGGQIAVHSQPGEGSTFEVRLPNRNGTPSVDGETGPDGTPSPGLVDGVDS